MTIQESSRIELNDYWNQEWLSLMKWVDCIGLLELTIFLPQKCKIDDFYLQSLLQSEIYSSSSDSVPGLPTQLYIQIAMTGSVHLVRPQ